MANHFTDDAKGRRAKRAVDRKTRSRRHNPESTSLGDTAHLLPYGEVASYRGPYGDALYDDSFYLDEVPARGGIRRLGRGLTLLLAWAVRLCAYATLLMFTLNALALSPLRSLVAYADDFVEQWLPWLMTGPLAVETPFGGVFRGELALACVALLVLDWLLCRLRAVMR